MGRALKTGFLALPLVAAAWFLGMVCRRMEAGHLLLAFAVRDLLPLLRDVMLVLAMLAVTSGVVALLFRPLWIAGAAFAVSGLAVLLSWGVTAPHVLLTFLLVLAALGHSAITQRDLSEHIRFSIGSVAASQLGFLAVLAAVVAGAMYMGAAGYVQEEGFSIPERYSSEFAERLASRAAAPFPSLIQEQVHNAVRSHAEQLLTEELEQLMKPIAPYVPIAAGLALFLPLLAVCCVLSWVVLPVLWLVFALLRATGVARIATETIEVERLVLS
jgi:hypothetical protein